ncbi:GMC oxidoreductase [Saccharospirillum sp.]
MPPGGTWRMGVDDRTVVDARFRVRGVPGLGVG